MGILSKAYENSVKFHKILLKNIDDGNKDEKIAYENSIEVLKLLENIKSFELLTGNINISN